MARGPCFAVLLASALAGCPEPLTLSAPGAAGPSIPDGGLARTPAADPPPACGGRMQPCCVDTELECAENLRCDLVTQTCVLADSEVGLPNCQRDADCAEGATCCPPQGSLRWCRWLEPGGVCPLPDLQVVVPVDGDLRIDEQHIAEGEPSLESGVYQGSACALEKECVRAPGTRRLLYFDSSVLNLGETDLVLGASGLTPQVSIAACDGMPFVRSYLRYELIDRSGAVAASNEGHVLPPACPNRPPVAGAQAPRFSCDFLGVPVGVVDTYGDAACQWVDITDVPAGEYVLRLTVNPDRVWPERNYENNSLEIPMVLPSFNPLAPCEAQSTDAFVYYDGAEPWCGWTAAPSASVCEPGEVVQVGCPDCTGDPWLRICEGSAPCTSATALASADDTYREEEGRWGPCPTVSFTCPSSGAYTWLVHPKTAQGSVACNVVPSP